MKQKPKLNTDKEKIYPHYGSTMMTCSLASMVKTTHICPIEGCDYTSRCFALESSTRKVQKESVSSKKCPKHNVTLLDVGMVMRIPGKGNKREKFLSELRGADIIKLRNKKNV